MFPSGLSVFLQSKKFVKHLLASFVVFITVLILAYFWLSAYTNHGTTVEVPDLKGLKLAKAISLAEPMDLVVEVSDSSVFMLDKPPGIIIDQDPSPRESVKLGRKVYVTITRSVPPQVKLPNLIDVSKRQADAILFSYGLKSGNIEYKPDLAKDVVLSVSYRGRTLQPGDEIPKGSALDMVLGDGLGNTEVVIPSLVGLSLEEAIFVIRGSGLIPGRLEYLNSPTDSMSSKVISQSPAPGDTLRVQQGDSINLVLKP
jgi:eukaryotic-like serine/threonine-protein kinase